MSLKTIYKRRSTIENCVGPVDKGVMKGSWVTTFAVGGVLILLTLFLGLQYNWLVQASDAERERMQRRVDADTRNFAEDFNREIQAAYFNFQTDAASWQKGDWTEFNERYDYWKSKTQYPELIRSFVYFGKDAKPPLRYDAVKRAFVEGEIEPQIAALRPTIESEKFFSSFYDEPFVLVMPVHAPHGEVEQMIIRRSDSASSSTLPMPERSGFLVIALDRAVVTEKLLPDLAAKHFPEGNFRVSVAGKEAAVYAPAGQFADGDAKAGLLSLTPDNLLMFPRTAVLSKMSGEKRHGLVISERVESKTFTHTESSPEGIKTGTFTVEVKPNDKGGQAAAKARTAIVATGTDGDPWTLNVQHTAGSIDAFTRSEFRKSFAVGLGLYLLLVGAIVAIVLSALRSKRFAQRQMDFVSSVSHEFRTPLAVIYSASENLADGVTGDREQVSRYGNLIKGEGRKLSAMVEQILQFAGARSGKKKYNFSPVNVGSVIDSAIDGCRPILEEKGIEIERAVDENTPPINADADALSMALQNLISNAVKYSNGSKWIRVAASNGDGSIKFSVKDRGIGIAANDLKQIFEPFYRSKEVVDAQIHGNGLGLALVKEIVEAHGGRVTAKNETGKGSEFVMEIPG